MRDEVDEGLVSGLAVTFVGTEVVVCVLSPHQRYVGGSIPVFGGERHAGALVGLEQGAVDDIVGIGNAACHAAGHASVVCRIGNAVGIVFAFLASVTTDVVDHAHSGKLAVYLVVDAVGDGSAGFADDDVVLRDSAAIDQRPHEGEGDEGG